MKVKEESERVGLKLNIQKTKVMASSPLTSWQIDGEKMETVRDFIFLGSKIPEDGDCSHEIKRRLVLGRNVMFSSSVYSCHLFLISSASVRHFCPLLCLSLHEMFPWNV